MSNVTISSILTLVNNNGTNVASSRDIARVLGKRHDNVIRSIRSIIKSHQEVSSDLSSPTFSPEQATYTDASNRQSVMFYLNKNDSMTLATGYSSTLRSSLVREWDLFEKGLEGVRSARTLEDAKMIAEACFTYRDLLRQNHPALTSLISEKESTLNCGHGDYPHIHLHRLAVKVALGTNPSTVRRETGMSPRDWLVDTSDFSGISKLSNTLAQIELMVKMNMSYKSIKEMLIAA